MEKTNQIDPQDAIEKVRIENSILLLIIASTAVIFGVAFLVAYSSQSYFLLKLIDVEALLCCGIVYAGRKFM